MTLHFVVSDYGLREYHKAAHTREGRWVISAAAVVLGLAVGLLAKVPEVAVLTAFLAGVRS